MSLANPDATHPRRPPVVLDDPSETDRLEEVLEEDDLSCLDQCDEPGCRATATMTTDLPSGHGGSWVNDWCPGHAPAGARPIDARARESMAFAPIRTTEGPEMLVGPRWDWAAKVGAAMVFAALAIVAGAAVLARLVPSAGGR